MPLQIPVGRRVFAPSLAWTAALVLVSAIFVGLGHWQWQRGALREAQWMEFAREGSDRAIASGQGPLATIPRFQRVGLTGVFDTRHQFLLDNRSHEGRAGYEVLTPLVLDDGRTVLVNRGWIAFEGYRDRLPDVSFDAPARVELTGRVDELPVAGLARGRAAPPSDASWPKLTSFPDVDQLGASLGRPIEPRIVLLDPREPYGFLRDWQPPGLSPQRHFGYAVQWWSFAAAAVGLWAYLSLR